MPLAPTDDGISIAYRTRGTGPRNLVFLHAWGASASYFDETIASLDLGSVRVPALVVAVARDPLHPSEDDVVASLTNARLEILDCGPEIPMELPVELAHLIERFVAELP